MAAGSSEITLHPYDASPFSHKVWAYLGLKGASWCSVVTPSMMPKPDLVPLTGGYRRAPVLQIGADIFCDSQAALAEIERRLPDPPGALGLACPVNLWSDRLFFQASVAIIFGRIGDRLDPAFIADQEALSGRPFDTAAWIEAALASTGEPFLAGAQPSLIDICAHMNLWFLGGVFPQIAEELLAGMERVQAWRGRVAQIGEGTRTEISGAEALGVARDAEPAPPPAHDADDPLGLPVGAPVQVAADDYGRDPILGALVAATRDQVVIAQETPDLGRLHLHFPRVGFVATPA
jgi:glutathione S-transferase